MEPVSVSSQSLDAPALRGFTLVEMLVVLAIIVIITGVTLVGQTSFNRSLLLTDTAYTVALSIRESQSLGLSSRRVQASSIQNAGYGVYITEGNTYVQFADIAPASPGDDLNGICMGHTFSSGPEARPGNCLYDSGDDTIIKTYRFDQGFTIGRFCGTTEAGAEYCSDTGTPLSALNVVFLRPNTETAITGIRSGSPIELMKAEIYLESADGEAFRGVCVTNVGQVAIATSTCP